jgi:hypothetical protein
MNFAPFDPSFFDVPATFALANLTVGQRGGTTEGLPQTATLNAFVEPDTDRAHRRDSADRRGTPTSSKRWKVITATNPAVSLSGLGLDDTVTALGLTMRIVKPPYDGSQGSGVLWVTECEEFASS